MNFKRKLIFTVVKQTLVIYNFSFCELKHNKQVKFLLRIKGILNLCYVLKSQYNSIKFFRLHNVIKTHLENRRRFS